MLRSGSERVHIAFFFIAVYETSSVMTSLRCLIDRQYCLSLERKKKQFQSKEEKTRIFVSSKLPLFLLQTELRRRSN